MGERLESVSEIAADFDPWAEFHSSTPRRPSRARKDSSEYDMADVVVVGVEKGCGRCADKLQCFLQSSLQPGQRVTVLFIGNLTVSSGPLALAAAGSTAVAAAASGAAAGGVGPGKGGGRSRGKGSIGGDRLQSLPEEYKENGLGGGGSRRVVSKGPSRVLRRGTSTSETLSARPNSFGRPRLNSTAARPLGGVNGTHRSVAYPRSLTKLDVPSPPPPHVLFSQQKRMATSPAAAAIAAVARAAAAGKAMRAAGGMMSVSAAVEAAEAGAYMAREAVDSETREVAEELVDGVVVVRPKSFRSDVAGLPWDKASRESFMRVALRCTLENECVDVIGIPTASCTPQLVAAICHELKAIALLMGQHKGPPREPAKAAAATKAAAAAKEAGSAKGTDKGEQPNASEPTHGSPRPSPTTPELLFSALSPLFAAFTPNPFPPTASAAEASDTQPKPQQIPQGSSGAAGAAEMDSHSSQRSSATASTPPSTRSSEHSSSGARTSASSSDDSSASISGGMDSHDSARFNSRMPKSMTLAGMGALSDTSDSARDSIGDSASETFPGSGSQQMQQQRYLTLPLQTPSPPFKQVWQQQQLTPFAEECLQMGPHNCHVAVLD